MTGFRFLATVCARLAGNKDANYMEDAGPPKLLSLDASEPYLLALAERQKNAA